MLKKSKMAQTTEFGSDWWNDSNDHTELQHAVNEGAVGATSNPVITCAAVKNHPELTCALLYLDFDIYKPTKVALESLLPLDIYMRSFKPE